MFFMDQLVAFGTLKGTKAHYGCRPSGWVNGTKHLCDDRTMLF